MSFLELRRVSKSYGEGAAEVHAIQDVNLSVEDGTLVAVMGPSGSGKSTLVTIAGSLEEPTSGEVVIDGASLQEMSRNDKARLRRRTIGWLKSNSLNGGIAALGAIPVADLLFILLVMPAFAAIVGWLFAGREPAAIAHSAIE